MNTRSFLPRTLVFPGVYDLLTLLGVRKGPPGVRKSLQRHSAYEISKKAKLDAPLTAVFGSYFPKDFSLLVLSKISHKASGYLFSITDTMKQTRMGLKYGNSTVFQYYDQNKSPGVASPSFNVQLSDDKWHHHAYSIRKNRITMYYDCRKKKSKPFKRSRHPVIHSNTVISIGSYFSIEDSFEVLFIIKRFMNTW